MSKLFDMLEQLEWKLDKAIEEGAYVLRQADEEKLEEKDE